MSLAVLTAFSCSKGGEAVPFDPPIIVEGWIEQGKAPVVMVTSAIEASGEKRPVDSLANIVLRYAKVSIDHNGQTYRLSSRLSDEYTLKNYYTTGDLRGEVGGTYRLNVEWNGKKATAVTSISEPAAMEYLTSEAVGKGDSLFVIKAVLANGGPDTRYYKFFTRILNGKGGYTPSFMGTFSNVGRPDPIEYTVECGMSFVNSKRMLYFHKSDTVSVKLATMEEPLFKFWEQMDQNSLCAVFPAVTFCSSVPSNVEGADGYWAGYGITEKVICVE